MTLRRIFLLGAAGLVSVAALVAIVAVVNGEVGETEGKIFATIAATFVAGSTVVAGLALLARGVLRPLGIFGVILAAGGFILWAEQIWAEHDSDGYWDVLLIVLTLGLGTLVVSANRLLLTVPRLVRTLFPATSVAAGLAAVVAVVMIARHNGDGWQLLTALIILALLGDVLAPILDRYYRLREPAGERLLGTVNGVSILAVRGSGGIVRVGNAEHRLSKDEGVIVRT